MNIIKYNSKDNKISLVKNLFSNDFFSITLIEKTDIQRI